MKIKTLLTALALTFMAAQAQEPYKVLAPIANVEDGDTAYLVNFDNGEVVDSAVIFDHTATFKGYIDEPILVRILVNGKRNGSLVLEPGTAGVNPEKRRGVGTMLNDALNIYSDSIAAIEQAGKDCKTEAETDSLFNHLLDYSIKVLEENSDNPIAMVVASDLFYMLENEDFIELVNTHPDLRKWQRVKKMMDTISTIKATSPGAKMLDFAVEYNGETKHLSDYVGRGKYVLVDFWASWCGPCMREIRNLKEIYQKYAERDDFQILGVAVWDTPADTEAAMSRLQLPWPVIINAQTIPTDLYGIMGIPSIFLFSPDGTILLRDKYGEDLQTTLDDFIK